MYFLGIMFVIIEEDKRGREGRVSAKIDLAARVKPTQTVSCVFFYGKRHYNPPSATEKIKIFEGVIMLSKF